KGVRHHLGGDVRGELRGVHLMQEVGPGIHRVTLTSTRPSRAGRDWPDGAARLTVEDVAQWLSIEVFDGAFPATLWRNAHGESLVEAALTNGAENWAWHEHRWGVVLEIAFTEEDRRDAF